MLPFVFMHYMGYMSIAVCLVLAYSLLGMEAISLEIEAPFGRCGGSGLVVILQMLLSLLSCLIDFTAYLIELS